MWAKGQLSWHFVFPDAVEKFCITILFPYFFTIFVIGLGLRRVVRMLAARFFIVVGYVFFTSRG